MSVTAEPGGTGCYIVQVWVKNPATGKKVHLKKLFDPAGNRRGSVKGSLRVAQKWEREQKAASDNGTWTDTTDETTVAGMFLGWVNARPRLQPASRASYESFHRTHLAPLPFGKMPYVKVREDDVEAWVKDRGQHLAYEPLRFRTGLLRSAFAAQVRKRKITWNPVPLSRDLPLPADTRTEPPVLSVPQCFAWAESVADYARNAVIVQAGTGLRMSELRALRENDVSLEKMTITVTEQLDATGNRAVLKNHRRKAARVRVIPLMKFTAKALAAQMLANPPAGENGLIFPGKPYAQTCTRVRKNGTTEILHLRNAEFFGQNRRSAKVRGTWDAREMGRAYKDGRIAAGIELPPGQNTHALRHHFASVMLGEGVPLLEVSAWLGDDPKVVLGTYGHLMPGANPGRKLRGMAGVDADWHAAAAAAKSRAPGLPGFA